MEIHNILATIIPSKTYAVAAFAKACTSWESADSMNYIVSDTETERGMRYFVVALPNANQI